MKRTKRQDEILDTALHLLADGGVKNLTMKRIAESIGVSEPAVYRHFKNKAEIVKGIIEKFDQNIITFLFYTIIINMSRQFLLPEILIFPYPGYFWSFCGNCFVND